MLRNFLSTLSADTLLSEPDTLAVFSYEGSHTQCENDSPNHPIPSLLVAEASDSSYLEVWKSPSPIIEHGFENSNTATNCTWRRSEQFQFITITAPLNQDDDFEKATYLVYKQLLKFIGRSSHPELVRFWNYIPYINQGEGDSENYKHFCTGRLSAFKEQNLDDLQFPAASAVGHYTHGITISALTSKVTAEHHANPRQVDAFRYPRQYGPSSPSFARATTVDMSDTRLCFISGTASILGHDSVHRGDLRLQLYTTNDNIRYLLKETGFARSAIGTMRVYLRELSDYPECKKIVEELYPNTNLIFTHADICRSDLLVEIECFCSST